MRDVDVYEIHEIEQDSEFYKNIMKDKVLINDKMAQPCGLQPFLCFAQLNSTLQNVIYILHFVIRYAIVIMPADGRPPYAGNSSRQIQLYSLMEIIKCCS